MYVSSQTHCAMWGVRLTRLHAIHIVADCSRVLMARWMTKLLPRSGEKMEICVQHAAGPVGQPTNRVDPWINKKFELERSVFVVWKYLLGLIKIVDQFGGKIGFSDKEQCMRKSGLLQ